jgi:DNA-binding NarL/FixJ family response regulator
MSVRVVVIDDHPVVRAGIVGLLAGEDDLEVVGEGSDGAEVLDLVERLRPDVVLMDLRMPRVDGATATGHLQAAYPEVRVVVLTTYESDADILRAVEAGATGYLLKDTPREDLVEAVRAAARGETVLSPSVARRLVAQVRGNDQRLTSRELEVLAAVARGGSNAQIGVDDRTRAVTVAMERGILPRP